MKPAVKWTLIGVGAFLVGGQLVRPHRDNPPIDPAQRVDAHVQVPADVAALMDRACADCHSHSTEWPWYSHVAPVSWMVAHHVNHGREYVNFDAWGAYTPYEAQDVLDEIAEVVEKGEMPLPLYVPLHPYARLTDAERARLVQWAVGERDRLREAIGSDPVSHEGHDH